MKEEKSTTKPSTIISPLPLVISNESTVLALPSKIACGNCSANMTNYVMKRIAEIDAFPVRESIPAYRALLEIMKSIPHNMCAHLIQNVQTLLDIELEKLKISEEAKLIKKKQPTEIKNEPDKKFKRIVFKGLKKDFLRKQAHYHFNPNNPDGEHLSVKQIKRIATMLFETYISEDETLLNIRTSMLALKEGFNMDRKGDVTFR